MLRVLAAALDDPHAARREFLRRRRRRRRARGRQARVAGLALLARPLVVMVVRASAARARRVEAAEDLALGRAHVRGLVPVLRRELR